MAKVKNRLAQGRIVEKIDREPAVIGYARASTLAQENSILSQITGINAASMMIDLPATTEWYDSKFPDEPEHRGIFIDRGRSAFRIPFRNRPAGARLLEILQEGDSLVVHRVDRLCRSMADFCWVIQELQDRKVNLVISEPRIDLSTIVGRAFAQILAVIAEWESARKSERAKAVHAVKKLEYDPKSPIRKYVSMPSNYRPRSKQTDEAEHLKGRVLVYVRVSHQKSVKSGRSIAAQIEMTNRYIESLKMQHPHLEFHARYEELAVSAYKHDFRNRQEGKRLIADLQQGDHVVFAYLDRGFRCVKDMVNTWPEWKAMGVDVHFVSEGLRMSDPMVGQLLSTILVQFAEMESMLTAARNRECRALMASTGRWAGGKEPIFWKVRHSAAGKIHLVVDRRQVARARLVRQYMKWWDRPEKMMWPAPPGGVKIPGLSWLKASEKLELLHSAREGRPYIPVDGIYPRTTRSKEFRSHFVDEHHKTRKHASWYITEKGRIGRIWSASMMKQSMAYYDAACEEIRFISKQRRGEI